LLQVGCSNEVSENSNAVGDVPIPVTGPRTANHNFFHATLVSTNTEYTGGALNAENLADFYLIKLHDHEYRTYRIILNGLTDNADLELYDAYLNRISWSTNPSIEDEVIEYWRNYTDLDNNLAYLKIINKSGAALTYDFEVQIK